VIDNTAILSGVRLSIFSSKNEKHEEKHKEKRGTKRITKIIRGNEIEDEHRESKEYEMDEMVDGQATKP